MSEIQRSDGGSSSQNKGNAANWKKFSLHLALLFLVSLGSSAATRYVMTRQKTDAPWKKVLNLTPEQEHKFTGMELEFNLAQKQLAFEDAQNKISLCAYLCSEKMEAKDIETMAKKMAGLYEQKQKTLAMTLAAISNLLTPQQKKIFSTKLMHEICVSCKQAGSTGHCLCGMCERHS